MKEYMTAKDIQELIPGIGYNAALKIINEIRKKMEELNYYVPKGKTKVALTWMIRKELGLK